MHASSKITSVLTRSVCKWFVKHRRAELRWVKHLGINGSLLRSLLSALRPFFRKKMSDDEAGITNDERFQLELEFVQCLASPQYLQCTRWKVVIFQHYKCRVVPNWMVQWTRCNRVPEVLVVLEAAWICKASNASLCFGCWGSIVSFVDTLTVWSSLKCFKTRTFGNQ